MFIHWGLYAVPAGTYHGKKIAGLGEWIMHDAKIPVAEYETTHSSSIPSSSTPMSGRPSPRRPA